MWHRRCVLAGLCLAVVPTVALGQTAPSPPQPLTLADAIVYANEHYPLVRAALEQVNASAATVDVAHSAYLPRLDSLWQSNRGTVNNVFGQVLPQSVIPSLSGPVLPDTSGEAVWGSVVGALFSWEPADFGLRRANIASAEAALTRARAGETLTRLDLEAAVGDAFLALLAAERAALVAQADLDRRTVLEQRIQTLVDNQLRPGADASRATAERAAAQTRLVQAQQGTTLAQITLGRLLGGVRVTSIDGARLVSGLPSADLPPAQAAPHPAIQVQDAALAEARSTETILSKTDLPRLYLLGSAFARGSGASTTGPFDDGLGGLALDRANWSAGFEVVFPNLFDFSSLRARKAAAAASTRAEVALDDEAKLTVASEQQSAAALVDSARAIAANTTVQLSAARQSETQARARYDAGLANITEIADAQSALAEAEEQDELARVDVWRALLATAVAQGDLAPLLTLIRQP